MEIVKVLEKAFKYPWKNKALLFYGVLIAIFSVGSNVSYFFDEEEIVQLQSYLNTFNFSNNDILIWFTIIGFIAIIVVIISILVSAWSKTSIINGVNQLEKGNKINRKDIGKTGKRTVWNLIVLSVFFPILVILLLILIVVPIVILVVSLPSPVNIAVGVFLSLLGIFILLPGIIYYGYIWMLSHSPLVLDNLKPLNALKNAKIVMKGNFWNTFLFSLILSIINGMVMTFLFIPFLIFGGLAMYFWSRVLVTAIIFLVILLFYLVFFIFLAGYFSSVSYTGWTVWWLELKKKKGKNGKK